MRARYKQKRSCHNRNMKSDGSYGSVRSVCVIRQKKQTKMNCENDGIRCVLLSVHSDGNLSNFSPKYMISRPITSRSAQEARIYILQLCPVLHSSIFFIFFPPISFASILADDRKPQNVDSKRRQAETSSR